MMLRRSKVNGHGSQVLLDTFRGLRNEVKALISNAKKEYIFSRITSCRNSRSAWQELRRLKLVKSKRQDKSTVLTPNELNAAFSAVFSTPPPFSDILISDIFSDLPVFPHQRFSLAPVSHTSVSSALSRISSNSTGTDSLPASYLRLVSDILLPQLAE